MTNVRALQDLLKQACTTVGGQFASIGTHQKRATRPRISGRHSIIASNICTSTVPSINCSCSRRSWYAARCVPQVFDLWQDPQERYDIFMNNYTEHMWMHVTYERFQHIREMLQKQGIGLPMLNGN
jgi:hypothetical protein